ncbi:MAG: hypothetical protein Q8M92_05140, partial [Candidatus Subteraquimicrobiales bacterium]|nr:hypothetical protein [Candidatus Subteraquimicrobiales bacterium]
CYCSNDVTLFALRSSIVAMKRIDNAPELNPPESYDKDGMLPFGTYLFVTKTNKGFIAIEASTTCMPKLGYDKQREQKEPSKLL